METHDRVAMGIIIFLLILSIAFIYGYIVIYGNWKDAEKRVDQCTTTLNQWAINQNLNQSQCNSEGICPIK